MSTILLFQHKRFHKNIFFVVYLLISFLCIKANDLSPVNSANSSSPLVARSWVGKGSASPVSGATNFFNDAVNWNPAGTPTGSDDLSMLVLGTSTTIQVTADITVNSLNITGGAAVISLDVQGFTLTINNNFSVTPAAGQLKVGVNGGSSAGVIDFKGNVTMGTSTILGFATFVGNTNSRLIFRKNLTMQASANVDGTNVPGKIEFLGSGAQVILWNTNSTNGALTVPIPGPSRFNNVVIGDATNNPVVSISASSTQKVDNLLGNLTINGSSVLDIGTNQWNRNATGGTFQMNGTSTLRLAGASSVKTGYSYTVFSIVLFTNVGGVLVTGSNFPGGFSTYSLSSTSTVEYYSSTSQTIYATPTYGNITLSDGIKVAGGPLTVAGNLLINSTAGSRFTANGTSGWVHNIAGNWTNNGTFAYANPNTINFNGNTNATIGGTSATNFYSLTVNKGTSTSTTLDVTSFTSTASASFLTFTNGLLRIQPTGQLNHNGAGPLIVATSGLHVNGGIFNNGNNTIDNRGLLRVSLGTASTGLIAGNSVDNNIGGVFDMSGGTLNIAGRLTFSTGASALSTISGGTINLTTIGSSSTTGTLDMTAATKINVSGGLITFKNANGSTGGDVNILSGSGAKSFTGGTLQFGTSVTPAAQVFKINSQVALFNLTLNSTNAPVTQLLNDIVGSNNITINNSTTFDAATNNKNIFSKGYFLNNSIFLAGPTVTFNGSTGQSISGTAPNTNFNNLTNSNLADTLTVNSKLTVIKQLTLTTGANLKLAAGNITLKSDLSGTANIGSIGTNNAITYTTGKFVVERYIPNHSKAWQFLAVPVNGNQTVNQAWQDTATAPNQNRYPGYGTIITSNVTSATSKGFDVYTPTGPTLKIYDSSTGGWHGIDSTFVPIVNKKGYMLFVRGNRSVTAYNQPATSTTLRTSGKLYIPGVDRPDTTKVALGKFASIGNPYASAINFSLVTKTGGVQPDFFYMWDPQLTTTTGPVPNSAFGYGGFQTFSWNGTSYSVTPGGGSYSGTNRNIESGQAFFVHSDPATGPGTVYFTEACKVGGSNLVNRVTSVSKQLRTNLKVTNGGDQILVDGILAEYASSYSNRVDISDGYKMDNFGENIGLAREGKLLAVERRAEILSADTLFFRLGQLRIQQYELELIATNLEAHSLTAFLEDNYLHSSTPVSLQGITNIPFTVTNDPGSYATDRFRIVFRQLSPVPVAITTISAVRNSDNSVAIKWKVENEISMQQYSVEHSANGRIFNGIITTTPTANNGGRASYAATDMNALKFDNFYRIRALSMSGQLQYSPIVKIAAVRSLPSIEVYPNPVTGRFLQLQFTGQAPGTYGLNLVSSNGQQQKLAQVQLISERETHSIKLPGNIAVGIYRLRVTGPANTSISKTIHISD